VSSTNRCKVLTTLECLEPTEKPEKKPSLAVANNILLNSSMKITKRKGEKGSSCLNPRELQKNLDGLPFTKTEKRTDEIQCAIQERDFSSNFVVHLEGNK
jgi:hypothetical protein